MASIKANVKTVKAQVLKMLSAGLAADFISKTCNVSPAMVRQWEEEYLKDILASGAGQRARLRHMLLRNSPAMINVLYKQGMQDVDSKLQVSAATTFLSFASRFLKEDASIAQAEARASEAAKGNIETTLFDFVIPGEANNQEAAPVADMDDFFEASEEGEEAGDEEGWELSPEDLDYSGNSDESTSDPTSS